MPGSIAAASRRLLPAAAILSIAPASASLAAAPDAEPSGVPFGAVAIGLVVLAALFFGLFYYIAKQGRDGGRPSAVSPPPPPPPPPPAPPEPTITLAGFDADGRSVRCEISRSDARRGVVIGRTRRDSRPRNTGDRIDISYDDRVSRKHIRIDHDGNGFRVTDLRSLNNTQINGKPLTPMTAQRLNQNDKLTLAEVLDLHVALNLVDGADR